MNFKFFNSALFVAENVKELARKYFGYLILFKLFY